MSVILEDSCHNKRKKPLPSKLVAFDKVSHRRPLSYSPLNYDEKGDGRFCSLGLWLLQQEKADRLRQDVPS